MSALMVHGAVPAIAQLPVAAVELSPVFIAINAIGICVFVVWVGRRLAHPRKLMLTFAPGRPNTINPAHIMIIMIAWIASVSIFYGVLGNFFPKKSHELKVLTALLAQMVWLAGSGAVAAVTFRFGMIRGLGLSMRHWLYDTFRGVLGYLAVVPICTGLFLASLAISGGEQKPHAMLEAIVRLPMAWKLLVALSAVVLAPIVEELFFRGLLQSMLRRYTSRPWVAIVVTSLFFSLIHINYPNSMAPIFALSVALGYNYERCGRLYPVMLMHMIFNAVSVIDTLWWG